MEVTRYATLVCMILLLCFQEMMAQYNYPNNIKADNWADSVCNTLSTEQKIAQLIFVRANTPGKPYFSEVDSLISTYNIGGVVFFKGDPVSQVEQTNEWNSMSKIPLMVAIDAEWGLSMRLSNTVRYPLQMTLGAVQNNNFIYAMGKQVGQQCRRMGIHMNFAPVVDVNSDPSNPVIGMRSFGQDPENVAQKGFVYAKGMQDEGIIACAKHFPGHGNTHVDSHHDLPVINSSIEDLNNYDLMPFRYLADKGVGSVMIAHLSVPAMDPTNDLPSTLSNKIVTDYLKDTLGFRGLIVTDGLDMKGVTKNFEIGEVALKALVAGNDILLIPDDVPTSIKNIVNAVKKGDISNDRIDHSCKKILKYKYLTGAIDKTPISTENLLEDLNQDIYKSTSQLLTEASITVLKNKDSILPLKDKYKGKRAMLVIGTENFQEVEDEVINYGDIDIFHIEHDVKKRTRRNMAETLAKYDVVIVAVLNTNISASRSFGITESDIDMVSRLSEKTKVILDIFASPYSLIFFDLNKIDALIMSYHENHNAQRSSVKLIMEGARLFGKLPVNAGGYEIGSGLKFGSQELYDVDPQQMGVDIQKLKNVDSIALASIELGATPGCQIIAVKDGAVFYNKSFGYHTYDKLRKVRWNDVYDIASLTKILATTPALMKLVEEGKIDLDAQLSDYLLMLKGTDKEELEFKEVLAHQSGLQNWIPFYISTLNDGEWNDSIYSNVISEEYPTRIAQNMYVRKDYDKVLFDSIIQSPFQDKSYHYSGLGFYLFKKMVEDITNQSFDDFLYHEFYTPLGLKYLRFNPRKYFNLINIIPTENDTVFRKQLLIGDVHDQGAALLGGVSGNAGLFGNTYNVAVFMQMLLNGGSYGDVKLLQKEVIDVFTEAHFAADSNRRGLGFDKPLLVYEDHMTNCKDASPGSFGHSGFTGTYAWADPENGLVYVFLSNRVHPDMNNTKLMKWDVRTNIHQLFYESIKINN